jgi:hypothetical protein
MKFLNMYDVSVAHATAPSAVERTLLVLADSEEAACKLVPSDQRVLRVKCSCEKARSAGSNRIIGFRGRPLAAAVKRALPADHPCSGPHPTD